MIVFLPWIKRSFFLIIITFLSFSLFNSLPKDFRFVSAYTSDCTTTKCELDQICWECRDDITHAITSSGCATDNVNCSGGGTIDPGSCHPTVTFPGCNISCEPGYISCQDDCDGCGCCTPAGVPGPGEPGGGGGPLNCTSSSIQYTTIPVSSNGALWVNVNGVANATSVKYPTWSDANGQDDIKWYEGAYTGTTGVYRSWIYVANHPPRSGRISVDPYVFQNSTSKFCGGVPFQMVPKTCSISYTRLTGGNNFSVSFSGNAQVNPGSGTVRALRELQSGGTQTLLGTLTSTNATSTSGTASITSLPQGSYYLHCDAPENSPISAATDGKCSGSPFCSYEGLGGSDACTGWTSCSASDNVALVVVDPLIYSTDGNSTLIAAETGSRNHICQTDSTTRADYFPEASGNRLVDFRISPGVILGGVSTVEVRVNGYSATMSSYAGGYRGLVSFPVSATAGIYPIQIRITYTNGTNTGWFDSTRNFKLWDCNVPASGTIHDNSANEICPNFGSPVGSDFSYTQTIFNGLFSTSTRTIPASSASTFSSDSSNHLIWGKSYLLQLNADINGSQPTGYQANTHCVSTTQLDITNSLLDPYVASPALDFNIGVVKNQPNWFQAIGGGVKSKTLISDPVPPTCQLTSNCFPAISAATTGESDNGLVWAPTINLGDYSASVYHSYPKNYSLTTTPNNFVYNYTYFFNHIFGRLGQGTTLASDSTTETKILSSGIYFVNGDLTLTADTPATPIGQYKLVVVKGNLTIEPTVTSRVDGLYLVDGHINIYGSMDSQLSVNGLLYSANSYISFTRTPTNPSLNNTRPPVIVNFRPDLIYNLPGFVTQVISGFTAY